MKYGYKLKQLRMQASNETDLNKKIALLESKIADLEQINKNKSLWLASLSHDFKGIFSNILWIAQTIEMGSINPETLWELFPDLKQAADHNLAVLEATFSAAKVHLQEGNTVLNTIHVETLFQELSTHFKTQLEAKSLELEFHGDLQAQFVSDKLLLMSALYKILDNAIKFSHKGEKIKFIAENQASGKLLLQIEDAGIGMDSKTLNRVFSLDHPPYIGTADELGAGFGLPLAKEVIYSLGGQIEIASQEKQGTNVSVYL